MTAQITWTNPDLDEDQAVILSANIRRKEVILKKRFCSAAPLPDSREFCEWLELTAGIAFSKAALNPDTTFTPSDLFDYAD